MMKKFFLRLALVQAVVLSMAPAYGQKVLEDIRDDIYKAGGVYYHYVYDAPCGTPAPKGYEPFYISHYGRHGSRWLSRETDYSAVREIFAEADSAGILTPFGKDVYSRVEEICDDAAGRAGALTPLGTRQHKEIAGRMAEAFPQVFEGAARINASSTTYPRCILSMAAFCERLKELEPALSISREASPRTTRYLNCYDSSTHPELSDDFRAYRSADAPWRKEYDAAAGKYVPVERVTGLLFSDRKFTEGIDAVELVINLYLFASDMQDLDLGISFYDLFTPDELYRLSVYENYRYFVTNGPSSINRGFPEYYGKLLLEDIVFKADRALQAGTPCADLRFGHDTNVMPLLTMLQFTEYSGYDRDERDMEAVAEDWTLYELSPMAANIQIIFYRNRQSSGEDGILVRMMHNEKEMHLPLEPVSGPYYRWSDVRKFYIDYMDSLKDPSGKAD